MKSVSKKLEKIIFKNGSSHKKTKTLFANALYAIALSP